MKKAKIKNNLIIIANTILSVIFAFIIGFTFAFNSDNLVYGTDPYATATYLANQQVIVLNDTTDNPVAYGIGNHTREITIDYSVDYEFDLRLDYSIVWTDDNSDAGDVAYLNFVNRDSFIVDNSHIFYAGTLNGRGTLKVVSGIDFIDTTQYELYNGRSVKVNITARFRRVEDEYSSESYLYDYRETGDVEDEARDAWLTLKNRDTLLNNSAYAMIYNYRHNEEFGVKYPGPQTAYKKDYSDGKVTSSTWLGGNKFYAGLGLYIITGDTPTTLQIKTHKLWVKNGTETEVMVDETAQYNYKSSINGTTITKDWTDDNGDGVYVYKVHIPANSTCYLDVLDNIEINCIFHTTSHDLAFDAYRLYNEQITLNGITFIYHENLGGDTPENTIFNVGNIACGLIPCISATGSAYITQGITVRNNSTYENMLVVNNVELATAGQSFRTNITYTNNTNQTKTITAKINVIYTLTNGSTLSTGTGAYVEYVEVLDSSKYTLSAQNTTSGNTTITIAPYSSVEIGYQIVVSDTLLNQFTTGSARNDIWIYLLPSISESGTSASFINIETKTVVDNNKSTIVISAKNVGTTVTTGISATLNIDYKQAQISESAVSTEPSDWVSSYWRYYYKNGSGNFVQVTKIENPEGGMVVPVFEADKYYKFEEIYYGASSSIVSKAEGFTVTTSLGTCSISNSSLKLQPNESCVIATINVDSNEQLVINASAKATSANNVSNCDIVRADSVTAYLVNYSSSDAYYVRFTGTITGSVENIVTDGGYHYYIGILRPQQLLKLDMSVVGTLEFVAVSGPYDQQEFAWKSIASVNSAFENYFN